MDDKGYLIKRTLKVSSIFRDDRAKGLSIVWELGSATLKLVRVGGPNGSTPVDKKSHSSYKQSAGALAGAQRWFDLLAAIYTPDAITARKEADADSRT